MPRNKSGQSILDFIVTFIAIGVLALGVVRIWVWFNANYAKRQYDYQRSRLLAATPKPTYNQPIDIGATPEEPGRTHQDFDLTEEWVFLGQASGGLTGVEGSDTYMSAEEYCKQPPDLGGCLGVDDCGTTPENFNVNCICYVRCVCLRQTQSQRDMYLENVAILREKAQEFNNAANGMRDAANDCDDPWELCWWGSWGKTPRELRRAADNLDAEANVLRAQANDIEQKANEIVACCNDNDTFQAQKVCLDFLMASSCQDYIQGLIAGLQAQIDSINEEINSINSNITEIGNVVST